MTVTMLKGDCRNVLGALPDESVHCVVTSPPYWGLRDYGTAKWDGGDPQCDHVAKSRAPDRGRVQSETYAPPSGWTNRDATADKRLICKCGARRIDSQIGLEQSPQEYVEQMVAVFREVRRVLRDDGTLWLNYGDCYAASQYGSRGTGNAYADKLRIKGVENYKAFEPRKLDHGLKPKDLIGIPWRVAFALQADGWYLRQDIIWSKPNPMPESVTDRCTKAHEYIFLLSKSARYYYDADAIREPHIWADDPRNDGKRHFYADDAKHNQADPERQRTKTDCVSFHANGRNKRSVWEVATAPFSEAHFATFPPALIEPCILAGCPEKCCAKCGAPWVREAARDKQPEAYADCKYDSNDPRFATKRNLGGRYQAQLNANPKRTTGFSPSCSCNADTVPGTTLDPFGGAGTTGLVADRLGRNAILIELNPEYAEMAERRIKNDAGMFASVST